MEQEQYAFVWLTQNYPLGVNQVTKCSGWLALFLPLHYFALAPFHIFFGEGNIEAEGKGTYMFTTP